MSFAIKGYQDDLKNKISKYGNDLAKAKNIDTQSFYNSSTGLKLSAAQQKQMQQSIFNVTNNTTGNNVQGAQDNKTQKQGSDAVTNFAQVITKTATAAVTALTQVIDTLMQKLNALSADQSALQSPQTSGQAVKPQDNMPTDNQGGEQKTAAGNGSQKPNVSFGEETVTDGKNKVGNEENKTKKADKEEREESTQQAQTSSELDKAAQKESQKQFQEAQQKLQAEAERIHDEVAA